MIRGKYKPDGIMQESCARSGRRPLLCGRICQIRRLTSPSSNGVLIISLKEELLDFSYPVFFERNSFSQIPQTESKARNWRPRGRKRHPERTVQSSFGHSSRPGHVYYSRKRNLICGKEKKKNIPPAARISRRCKAV